MSWQLLVCLVAAVFDYIAGPATFKALLHAAHAAIRYIEGINTVRVITFNR